MRKKIGELKRGNLYVMVYGNEGCGKTLLAMSLSEDYGKTDKAQHLRGLDVAYITADSGGPTSVISAGYSPNIPCEVLDGKADPFPGAIRAVRDFTADKSIRVLCLDNVTGLAGAFVRFFTDGGTDKDMGYEGWGELLSKFRNLEAECEAATRAGKSVIYTAWPKDPTYREVAGTSVLDQQGRAMIPGQGQRWLPGNCDVVARMTSRFKKMDVGGKAKQVFSAELHLFASEEWHAKTRWPLPNPFPADLRKMLDAVNLGAKEIDVAAKAPVKK